MKRNRYLQLLLAVVTALALTPVWAAVTPVPITADEAFDAAATQTDPLTGQTANVALVDVRTRAEYYWVGTAAKVLEIKLKGQATIVRPDDYKVRLIHEGKFLEYTVNGRYQRVQVDKVESLKTEALAISVPFRLWNETTASLVPNPGFAGAIDKLADNGVTVLIVYCRSGVRSTACVEGLGEAITDRFDAIYEIDVPDGRVGYGGFEGAFYNQVYNGYVGFPGRQTDGQDTNVVAPSVSWKDSGLPIKIGVTPPPSP